MHFQILKSINLKKSTTKWTYYKPKTLKYRIQGLQVNIIKIHFQQAEMRMNKYCKRIRKTSVISDLHKFREE